VLEGRPTHSLVSLTSGYVESEEQTVRRAPLDDDASHGEVCGEKSRGRRRRFAEQAQLEVVREDALKPEVQEKLAAARATEGA
jgi:hypothetical protein